MDSNQQMGPNQQMGSGKNDISDQNMDSNQKSFPDQKGEHVGSPLRNVVQWFKTMSTNEYIRCVKTLVWKRVEGKLWQRDLLIWLFGEVVIKSNNCLDPVVKILKCEILIG
jgi:hypothetical protein